MGGELRDVDRTELQHIGRDAWQAEIEVLFQPFSVTGAENAVPSNEECTPLSIFRQKGTMVLLIAFVLANPIHTTGC